MSGIKKYMPVAAVFLFALLVRIIYNITVARGYIPEYDAHQYNDNMWRPYTSEEGLPVREFPDRPASQVVWTMMQITPIPLFLFAAIGIIVTRKQWQHLLLPYLSILLTIIQCLVFYGSSRLRAPIEPMLVLLAAGAIWWLTQNEPGTLRWKRTRLIKKSGDEQLATS